MIAISASHTSMASEIVPRSGKRTDRKSTRLNSSHLVMSYAVFCLKKKKQEKLTTIQVRSRHSLFASGTSSMPLTFGAGAMRIESEPTPQERDQAIKLRAPKSATED